MCRDPAKDQPSMHALCALIGVGSIILAKRGSEKKKKKRRKKSVHLP